MLLNGRIAYFPFDPYYDWSGRISHREIVRLVIIDRETKTTWRMSRDLLKDLKRYALENDTNVTAVVLREGEREKIIHQQTLP